MRLCNKWQRNIRGNWWSMEATKEMQAQRRWLVIYGGYETNASTTDGDWWSISKHDLQCNASPLRKLVGGPVQHSCDFLRAVWSGKRIPNPAPVQTGPGAHPAYCQIYTGYNDRVVAFSTHPHQAARLKKDVYFPSGLSCQVIVWTLPLRLVCWYAKCGGHTGFSEFSNLHLVCCSRWCIYSFV